MSVSTTITARRLARAARAFREGRTGAAAVEFALVVPAFLALMFSIFEVGWFYFVNSQVDAATLRAARFIRTGQVAAVNMDKAAFFSAVCPPLEMFGNCTTTLTVEVREFASYAALAADTSQMVCADGNSSDINTIPYQPGSSNSIIRLRLCLIYKTMNPALGVNLAETAEGKKRIFGQYLFRNEPFTRSGG